MVSTVHRGSRKVTRSRTVALPSAANPAVRAAIALGFLPAGRLLTNSCPLTFMVTRAVIRISKYFFIFPITENRAAYLALAHQCLASYCTYRHFCEKRLVAPASLPEP